MAKAFTLIEVLVASTLLGVGVAAVIGGIRSVNQAEQRARELEVMQRLAVGKYDELRSITDTFAAGDSGDFVDQQIEGYTWEMKVEPTGVQNVEGITVIVTKRDASEGDPVGTVSGLVFEKPEDTDAGATE